MRKKITKTSADIKPAANPKPENKIKTKVTKRTDKEFSDSELENIIDLASHGIPYEKIENINGYRKGSIAEYCMKSDEFARKLKNAEIMLNIEAEKALYKRAMGYDTLETHHIYTPNYEDGKSDPEIKLKEIRKVQKYVPPDGTAALIVLCNRNPERWSKNPDSNSGASLEDYLKKREITYKQIEENM